VQLLLLYVHVRLLCLRLCLLQLWRMLLFQCLWMLLRRQLVCLLLLLHVLLL